MKRKLPEKAAPFVLEVEHVPPTAQQAERVREGLGILAAWLVRHHRRKVAEDSALTSAPERAPLSGDVEAASGT